MESKKLLVMGDTHTGHIGGLTPPAYWVSKERCETLGGDWRNVQKTCWKFFKKHTDKKYDGGIFTGDAIDGVNPKGYGRECLTTDPEEQAEWNTQILKTLDVPKWAVVFGSPYHVGKIMRWETMIAKRLGADIRNIQEIEVFGKMIRVKHKMTRSSTPVGGDIALRKAMVNELVWERDHGIKPADIYIYGHAHYFRYHEDAKWHAMIAPSLQAWTEFGATQCTGSIHFGTVDLTIREDGKVTIDKHLMELQNIKLSEPLQW